ncbi:DUF4838 domain-containing protein [Nannocystis pusilla]|uniref:DUF4838 domain-containing protein n=1 Tax=Nannocystis pusilla TaxID=889268 RepID=UPI003DA61944
MMRARRGWASTWLAAVIACGGGQTGTESAGGPTSDSTGPGDMSTTTGGGTAVGSTSEAPPTTSDTAATDMGPPVDPLTLEPAATVIVTPVTPDAQVTNAASFLQAWLRRVSGVMDGFAIVAEPDLGDPAGKVVLALDRTQWADATELDGLWHEGFVLRRTDDRVVIAGGGPRGTFMGVVGFLDRFVGVRFYMPGELFTAVPPPGPITLGAVDVVDEPYARSVFMTGVAGVPGDGDWAALNAVNNRRLGGTHQHNMYEVFPPEKYMAKYPEIYPVVNGVPYVPTPGDQGWQPCFSEPTLVDAAEETALAYFAANPTHAYLSFSINDSGARCERDPQDDTYAATYWTFMVDLATRLAPQLPDKLILGLAYGNTNALPAFPLHDNIIVFTNLHVSEYLQDGISGSLAQWLGAAKHYGNHEWAHGIGFFIPRIYTGFFADFMRQIEESGVDGSWQHMEGYPNWGLDGLKLYVMGRLWWRPATDVPALWRQICDDLFGPASDEMFQYFELLEQLWTILDNMEGERKLYKWSNQFDTSATTAPMVAQARVHLDAAAALAATDAEKQRIALISKTFHVSEILFEGRALAQIPAGFVDEAMAFFMTEIVPDPMTFKRNSDQELIGNFTAALQTVTNGK